MKPLLLGIVFFAGVLASSEPLCAQTNARTNPQANALTGSSESLANEGFTAEEAYAEAQKLFREKNYPAALEAYSAFVHEYENSKEAAVPIFHSLYPLAICYVFTNRFSEAVDPLKKALDAPPPSATKLTPAQEQDLWFWLGVAQMQAGNYPEARAALEKFISLFPQNAEKDPAYTRRNPAAGRLGEARSLLGTTYILEGKFREAADYFATLKPSLSPENRGRAVIFQLHALIELGDYEQALQLVTEEYPRMPDITQLISFQTLTLQLGNHWLEKGHFRKTILCLQRIWPFERLIKHQEQRLESLKSRLKAAEAAHGGDHYGKILFSRLVNEVTRELESFRKVENFDTALRFRLAIAYLKMKRYREAALVMDEMVDALPPSNLTEQAAVNVVRCWSALEDWPQAIASARKFVSLYPGSPLVPLVLYMEAEALQSSLRYDEAGLAFQSIVEKHPSSEYAQRSMFMQAFTRLQAEKYADSARAFDEFLSLHPKHALADDAAYWKGVSFSFDKQYGKCRELMDEYLKAYPNGTHRGAAVFRKAYCMQQMERYGTAIDELHEYLEQYPGDTANNEARILLGNALMNEGFMQDGIDEFKKIPASDTKPYEEGVFRSAEGLKLMEEYDQYRDLMSEFIERNPRSPRVAEAIGNLGWYYRQLDQPEKAREIYWQAINEHGDDPAIRSIDDLFPSLARLYRGPEESSQYLSLLEEMAKETASENKLTLQMRLLHAQAQTFRRTDPEKYRELLFQSAALCDVRNTNPALLVEFGNAYIDADKTKEGEAMLRDTLRWNPRAIQKDKILAALGKIELERGNEQAALDYFTRFEKENLGSSIFGETMLAKAKLHHKRNQRDVTRRVLEEVLKSDATRGDIKAEALLLLGESHMAANDPKPAIAYFQRIYVMYGRWKPWVAKAYLQSGQGFEKLNDTESARRTYQELATHPDLEDFPETTIAKARLDALGGPLPSDKQSSSAPASTTPAEE